MPPGAEKLASEVLKNYGFVGLVLLIVLVSCLGLIYVVIKMGDKHLTFANQIVKETSSQFSTTIVHIKQEHREEREKWYEQYDRIAKQQETASNFNREEHGRIMGLLAQIEGAIRGTH